MKPPGIASRLAEARRLQALGVTGAALRALLWEGRARGEHATRVAAAKAAAREHAFALLDWSGPRALAAHREMLLALGLLALDAYGVGRAGAKGGGSTRLPCFQSLATGRTELADGPDWDAALAAAFHELFRESCGGPEHCMAFEPAACGLDVSISDDGAAVWRLPLPAGQGMEPWYLAVAFEGLRRAAHGPRAARHERPLAAPGKGTPAQWAAVVNRLA